MFTRKETYILMAILFVVSSSISAAVYTNIGNAAVTDFATGINGKYAWKY